MLRAILLRILSLFLVLYVVVSYAFEPPRPRPRYEKVVMDPSIVHLIGRSSCTGFIVAKDTVATAFHCVDHMDKDSDMLIEFVSGNRALFKVIAHGSLERFVNDWAILQGPTGELPALVLSSKPAKIYDKGISVGYTEGDAFQFATPGVVLARVDGALELALFVYPGDSGSPFVSMETGEVLGIVSATRRPFPGALVVPAESFSRIVRRRLESKK